MKSTKNNAIAFSAVFIYNTGMDHFIPILKTKRFTEKTICKFIVKSGLNAITPYLEIIKDPFHLDVHKYREILKEKPHYEELYRKPSVSLKDAATAAESFLAIPNVIPSVLIKASDPVSDYSYVAGLIDKAHQEGRPVAVRFQPVKAPENLIETTETLRAGDSIIIDIGLNDFFSTLFSYEEWLGKMAGVGIKVIAFSQERDVALSGKKYKVHGDSTQLFHTSLQTQLPLCSVPLYGFGSTCTLRDDLTGEEQIAITAYGLLILYRAASNSFYTVRTQAAQHVAASYKQLQRDIDIDPSKVLALLSATPVSLALFNQSAPSVIQFQKISAIHYIEEIINHYGFGNIS